MYTDASVIVADATSIRSLEQELSSEGIGTSALRRAAGLEVFYGLEGDPSAFDKLPLLGAAHAA
jgi:hypothetical protein